MSKVVNEIMATKTDKVRYTPLNGLFQDVFSVREDIQDGQHLETQYRIGVTIGAQCWISDLDRVKSDTALQHAIERTKRQVIEAIFGEFRQDFRMIERAIYDSDTGTAGKLLHEMEKKMFEVVLSSPTR